MHIILLSYCSLITLCHSQLTMAPFGTLYSYTPNPRVSKIQAAANMNGLEIELAPGFAMGTTNRSPEFLSKFPLGKVPAFAANDTNGTNIWESDAIAQFVAESGPAATQLLGSTPAERAVIRQWICFANNEITDPVIQLALWRIGIAPFDENKEKAALARLDRSLSCLDGHLKGRTWLATQEKLSLADISAASALIWGFGMVIDAEMRKKYPAVVEWYERTLETKGVKEAFGEKNFIEKRKEGGQ